MSAAVAATAATSSSYAQLFGSPSIDARLNLSLDDLIKERKKETNQKKREPVKQEPPTKKAEAKQKKSQAAANAQSEKRQEKMNKNRGLAVAQSKKKLNVKENNNHSNGKAAKKLQRKKKNKQTNAATAGRNVTSPKAKAQPQQQQQQQQTKNAKKNGNISPSQKTKNQQNQQKTPTLSPKQHAKKKAMTFVVKSATTNGREVNKTTKGKQLQIKLVQSKRINQQKHQQQGNVVAPSKNQKKKLPTKAAKALLPGKAQPKTRRVLAQTIVKKAKAASRKQWTSQNGKFTVRKAVVVRKA